MTTFKTNRPNGIAIFNWNVNKQDEVDCGVSIRGYSVCRAPRYQTGEQWNEDAKLICEAFNVANETGKTPVMLNEQLSKAVDILKRIGTGNRYTTTEINSLIIEIESKP